MAVFRPTYTDKKTGKSLVSKKWWYQFWFDGKRIRESTKTTKKTVALDMQRQRRDELEKGYGGIEDRRAERIRTVSEIADEYLDDYRLRHKSATFAQYALGHVKVTLARRWPWASRKRPSGPIRQHG